MTTVNHLPACGTVRIEAQGQKKLQWPNW